MSDQFSQLATELVLEAVGNDQRPVLVVSSNSMAPSLRRGDQVQLSPASLESLVVGDIVVIGSSKDLLTHRFWGVISEGGRSHLVTRGDRLPYFDPLIPADQLRAIVVGRRRSGRFLALDHGLGNWLNHQFRRLAELEGRVMRLSVPSIEDRDVPPKPYGVLRKFCRRSLYSLAFLLDWLVDHLVR